MGIFEKIPISKIQKGDRIRKDKGNLKQLAKLITPVGLLNPITVCLEADGSYTLLAGERRFEACIILGWDTIDAHILNCEELV